MPVPSPDHLLNQADRLIAPTRGGAPRQTDLRRAIPNAYYAVFHSLVSELADDLVGRTRRGTPRYALVYRSVDHRRLRELCESASKPIVPKKISKYEPPGGFGQDLIVLATAVMDLQEKRHLADYDPLFRTAVADVALDIAKARTALARFRHASLTQRRAFLSLLAFPPRQS